MSHGPIKRNQRTCVRCADEPALSPNVSVFALGQACVNEVMPRGTLAEQQAEYARLVNLYGYREVR